jgi:hypothetical protein
MNLTDEQKARVAQWLAEGLKLSDVQRRLASELGVNLTYLETRFLLDDLKLTTKDPEPPKQAAPTAPLPPATPQAADQTGEEAGEAPLPPAEAAPESPAASKVSVSVDQITRAGAVVSGKVTFSDGQKADWFIDQYGRFGMGVHQKGYKPSPQDLQTFQVALEKEMAKLGF